MSFDELAYKALKLGAKEFGRSNVKNKKWYVVYNNKKINFGDNRYDDYTTHRDKSRRKNYLLRAKAIRNKYGELTYNNKNYPNYWAVHLLW